MNGLEVVGISVSVNCPLNSFKNWWNSILLKAGFPNLQESLTWKGGDEWQ
jgi:hypothetical protein